MPENVNHIASDAEEALRYKAGNLEIYQQDSFFSFHQNLVRQLL
jgi:hypothetical protein